jgi:hypothetical protein
LQGQSDCSIPNDDTRNAYIFGNTLDDGSYSDFPVSASLSGGDLGTSGVPRVKQKAGRTDPGAAFEV